MGVVYGSYFTVRDHLLNDCYSGIFHTASLLIDIHKVFNWKPYTDFDVFSVTVEPIFALLMASQSLYNCIIENQFYIPYNEIQDQYFPDFGFDLFSQAANQTETVNTNSTSLNTTTVTA